MTEIDRKRKIMMLERIRIQNFQKHERLQIDFHPAVTTIVGSTDAGKSSVIRAIKWVALNQPSGEAFIRDGADGTTVKMTVDGKTVMRRRGGSRNEYRLDSSDYKAFGADVPKPVADALQMTDVNFAMQLDAPFWLAETPGEVSRRLNAVVDLKVIDDALSGIASAVRRSQTVVDVCRDRLKAAEETEKGLAWVPKAADAFDRVEGLNNVYVAVLKRRLAVYDLDMELKGFAREQRKAAQAASAGRTAMECGRELRRTTKTRSGLAKAIATCSGLVAAATEVPDAGRLDDLYMRCGYRHEERLGLGRLIIEMKSVRIHADNSKRMLESAKDALVVGTEGLCPICGSDLSE